MSEDLNGFKNIAEMGFSDAQYMYALELIEANPIESFKWMKKSAEQDYVPAQYMLGRYYLESFGTEENDEEGVKWIKKAAEKENNDAELLYGQLHMIEEFPEFSLEKAKYWLKRAISHGNQEAEDILKELDEN